MQITVAANYQSLDLARGFFGMMHGGDMYSNITPGLLMGRLTSDLAERQALSTVRFVYSSS